MTEPEPWWRAAGYLAGEEIGETGLWKCLADMAYTWRVLICTPVAPLEFWCYPKPTDGPRSEVIESVVRVAVMLHAWDPLVNADPPDGWVKHWPTMRRRDDGDPATEYRDED